MKANAKAKRASAKPTNRKQYLREWNRNHPAFPLRFDSKDQFEHIKRAAEITSAPSVNEYIVAAAIKHASVDLAALPPTAPA